MRTPQNLFHELASHRLPGATLSLVMALLICGCGSTAVNRKVGQTELFYIHPVTQKLLRPQDVNHPLPMRKDGRKQVSPVWGDRIRFSTDTLLIRVESAYLADKPFTLTGSSDVLLFADVSENAAAGGAESPLTYILYSEKNQLIPGRLNFTGAIAYGPTFFKGHPLKIKFTLMILQKAKGEQRGNVADVVSKYAAAIPAYGAYLTPAAAVIRDVLRAQPDIVAFDYEAVLISDKPEKFLPYTSPKPLASAVSASAAALNKSLPEGNTQEVEKPKDVQTDLDWKNWDDSFGWLQYGQYAIVETACRKQSKWLSALNSTDASETEETDIPQKNRYDRTKPDTIDMQQTGGWLQNRTGPAKKAAAGTLAAPSSGAGSGTDPQKLKLTGSDSRAATPEPKPQEGTYLDLDCSYIIFSIVPGQLSEEISTLRDASAAANKMIGSLRQTSENVSTAFTTIDQTAKDLKYSVVKNQADALADNIAKSGDLTYGQFKAKFSAQYTALMGQFGNLPVDLTNPERQGIEARVISRYEGIYTSIGKLGLTEGGAKLESDVKVLKDEATGVNGNLDTVAKTLEDLKTQRDGAVVDVKETAKLEGSRKSLEEALAKIAGLSTTPPKISAAEKEALDAKVEEVRKLAEDSLNKVKQLFTQWGDLNAKASSLGGSLSQAKTSLVGLGERLDSLNHVVEMTTQDFAAKAKANPVTDEIEKSRVYSADANNYWPKAVALRPTIDQYKSRQSDLQGQLTALINDMGPASAKMRNLVEFSLAAQCLSDSVLAAQKKLDAATGK